MKKPKKANKPKYRYLVEGTIRCAHGPVVKVYVPLSAEDDETAIFDASKNLIKGMKRVRVLYGMIASFE